MEFSMSNPVRAVVHPFLDASADDDAIEPVHPLIPAVSNTSSLKEQWGVSLTIEQWREAGQAAKDSLPQRSDFAPLWGALHLGLIDADRLTVAIGTALRKDIVTPREFADVQPDRQAVALVKYEDMKAGKILPYRLQGNKVRVLLVDPTLTIAKKVLGDLAALDVDMKIGPERLVLDMIDRLAGSNTTQRLDSMAAEVQGRSTKQLRAVFGLEGGKATESEIGSKIDSYLETALKSGASDVHFDPLEDGLSVGIRVDGRIQEIARITPATSGLRPEEVTGVVQALLRRVFVMAKRSYDSAGNGPQDGAFTWVCPNSGNRKYDVRFAAFSTTWGRDMVSITLRFLSVSRGDETLNNRGFESRMLRTLHQAMQNKEGILINTGPTGSGKSTTMHAMLRYVYRPDLKVITIEDPVERKVSGYRQLEVVPSSADATYPKLLKATLRMDPDVLLVGEIRDEESAEVAIAAANTGHLVLTTVHANTALMALMRLQSLGVSPFLLSTTTKVLLAQRLIRRLCRRCAAFTDGQSDTGHLQGIMAQAGYDPNATWADFGLTTADMEDGLNVLDDLARTGVYLTPPDPSEPIWKYKGLKHPRGCSECQMLGTSGRVAVFEVIPMSRALRESVVRGESTPHWEEIAFAEGGRTLFANGLLRALRGETSVGALIGALGPGYERGTPL